MPREKLERLPPAWAKLHRVSAGNLLILERQAAKSLRRVARAHLGDLLAVHDGAAPMRRDLTKTNLVATIRRVGSNLRIDFASAVTAARGAARDGALRRLEAETAQLEKELGGDIEVARPEMSDAAEDAGHGDAAGSSFSSAWTTTMTAATMQDRKSVV